MKKRTNKGAKMVRATGLFIDSLHLSLDRTEARIEARIQVLEAALEFADRRGKAVRS